MYWFMGNCEKLFKNIPISYFWSNDCKERKEIQIMHPANVSDIDKKIYNCKIIDSICTKKKNIQNIWWKTIREKNKLENMISAPSVLIVSQIKTLFERNILFLSERLIILSIWDLTHSSNIQNLREWTLATNSEDLQVLSVSLEKSISHFHLITHPLKTIIVLMGSQPPSSKCPLIINKPPKGFETIEHKKHISDLGNGKVFL